MSDEQSRHTDQFIQLLTKHQSQLLGFINASLGDYTQSEDVLQKTNLALWKKVDQFEPGAEFMPWAMAVARFEILSHFRDYSRKRLVFSPDVAELMADTAATLVAEVPLRQIALRECLERQSENSREALRLRYVEQQSIDEISAATDRSADGVKSLLLRVRKSLRECIEKTLSQDSS